MSDAPPRKRLLGLDALRGIAVFLMIEQHLGVWLWRGPNPGERMSDYPGLMVFNATGFSTFDEKKIPPKLRQILETRYPTYLAPPPLDDARPNETTWTITKKAIDAQRAREQR